MVTMKGEGSVLVCPFDSLPCRRSGRCGAYCHVCKVVHPKCSRFDLDKYNSDASFRRLFG
jgi:hypothetical protein